MSLMFQPLKKYAEFTGRARRSEYWLFAVFCWLLALAWFVIAGMAGMSLTPGSGFSPGVGAVGLVTLLFCLVELALIIPSIAVSIRRLHDIDKSGWWVLIGLVPLIGPLVLLIFMLLDGTMGPNRYGPDPKNRAPGAPTGPVVADPAASA